MKQSSNIDSFHYNSETKVLEVQFKNGGIYHYEDVSPDAYSALENASSFGKHLHKHIKPNYQVKKK